MIEDTKPRLYPQKEFFVHVLYGGGGVVKCDGWMCKSNLSIGYGNSPKEAYAEWEKNRPSMRAIDAYIERHRSKGFRSLIALGFVAFVLSAIYWLSV